MRPRIGGALVALVCVAAMLVGCSPSRAPYNRVAQELAAVPGVIEAEAVVVTPLPITSYGTIYVTVEDEQRTLDEVLETACGISFDGDVDLAITVRSDAESAVSFERPGLCIEPPALDLIAVVAAMDAHLPGCELVLGEAYEFTGEACAGMADFGRAFAAMPIASATDGPVRIVMKGRSAGSPIVNANVPGRDLGGLGRLLTSVGELGAESFVVGERIVVETADTTRAAEIETAVRTAGWTEVVRVIPTGLGRVDPDAPAEAIDLLAAFRTAGYTRSGLSQDTVRLSLDSCTQLRGAAEVFEEAANGAMLAVSCRNAREVDFRQWGETDPRRLLQQVGYYEQVAALPAVNDVFFNRIARVNLVEGATEAQIDAVHDLVLTFQDFDDWSIDVGGVVAREGIYRER